MRVQRAKKLELDVYSREWKLDEYIKQEKHTKRMCLCDYVKAVPDGTRGGNDRC